MKTKTNYLVASIAIIRTKGWIGCKSCGFTIGSRSPRGELAFQVTGNRRAPRFYHFGCYAKATEDYELSLNAQIDAVTKGAELFV